MVLILPADLSKTLTMEKKGNRKKIKMQPSTLFAVDCLIGSISKAVTYTKITQRFSFKHQ